MNNPVDSPTGKTAEDFVVQTIVQRADEAYSAEKHSSSDYQRKITDLKVKQQQSNQEFRRQVVSFRKGMFWFLLILMTIETVALFVIIILASLPTKALLIEDVTLQILVGATIAQISVMMIVIIRSVYSDSLNKLIMSDRHTHGTS